MRPAIKVGLSTASVYPLRTEAAFDYAARLGYDGVELMVWAEPVSQDIDAIAALSQRYGIPVLSVHAPCLLISQRVWGANPISKLERSVRSAEQLGAQTVVAGKRTAVAITLVQLGLTLPGLGTALNTEAAMELLAGQSPAAGPGRSPGEHP